MLFSKVYDWFVLKFIGNITFTGIKRFFTGRDFDLDLTERRKATEFFFAHSCLALSRRKTHLTTYLIAISEMFLRGKWGYWSHAFFNIEADASALYQLQFVEAIGKGVVENDPVEVLNCDSIVLLVPNLYFHDEKITAAWDQAVANVRNDLGKKYDTKFKIKDHSKVSCVELILEQLQEIEGYERHFSGLIRLINKEKNLTPDMLYDCGDFRVLYEVRH